VTFGGPRAWKELIWIYSSKTNEERGDAETRRHGDAGTWEHVTREHMTRRGQEAATEAYNKHKTFVLVCQGARRAEEQGFNILGVRGAEAPAHLYLRYWRRQFMEALRAGG
jgi:hypothetical protein